MTLSADDVQATGHEHLVMPRLPLRAYFFASSVVDGAERIDLGFEVTAEDDVGTSTGHVGRDRYGARPSGLGNDLRLTLVLLRVQDLVRNVLFLQQAG